MIKSKLRDKWNVHMLFVFNVELFTQEIANATRNNYMLR